MLPDVTKEGSKIVQKGLFTVHLGSQNPIAIISGEQQSRKSLKYLINPRTKLNIFKLIKFIDYKANCMRFAGKRCTG